MPGACWVLDVRLTLGLTARCLLALCLVLAAGAGAGSLSRSLLTCSALYLLALFFIGDRLGVCHGVPVSFRISNLVPGYRARYRRSSCANFSTSFFIP